MGNCVGKGDGGKSAAPAPTQPAPDPIPAHPGAQATPLSPVGPSQPLESGVRKEVPPPSQHPVFVGKYDYDSRTDDDLSYAAMLEDRLEDA